MLKVFCYRFISIRVFFILSIALSSISSVGYADSLNEGDTFLDVEDAYQVLVETSESEVALNWMIEPGYYLYQHQFAITAQNTNGVVTMPLEFEPGITKYDDYFQKELTVYYNNTRVTGKGLTFKTPLELQVKSQGCADAGLCYPPRTQFFSVDDAGVVTEIETSQFQRNVSPPGQSEDQSAATAAPPLSLPYFFFIIFSAILGGMVLNLMPCVFPVLSLKALSFASLKEGAHKHHVHGWAYTAGVVSSFLFAAVLILVARSSGEHLGWGFQLQQPEFVALMAYLFVVMGLSLSGAFNVGGSWMGMGQSLTAGEDLKSYFFTGVLAALVASPCTAPFMATALGVAVTQPAIIALAIFASLGFGLALPFLLISYSPGIAKKLPAPGMWMERLKEILAFPLYLTSVWLFWVLGHQATNSGAALALMGAVFLAFGLWLLQSLPAGNVGRRIQQVFAISFIAVSIVAVVKVGQFRDNKPALWQAYTPELLEKLRAQGDAVFIDLTADWCITCKINERVALHREDVITYAIENDIAMLQGDWTNSDPNITELLRQFGRNGVPLYLMYPANSDDKPEILPQILTESRVLEAMATAVGE